MNKPGSSNDPHLNHNQPNGPQFSDSDPDPEGEGEGEAHHGSASQLSWQQHQEWLANRDQNRTGTDLDMDYSHGPAESQAWWPGGIEEREMERDPRYAQSNLHVQHHADYHPQQYYNESDPYYRREETEGYYPIEGEISYSTNQQHPSHHPQYPHYQPNLSHRYALSLHNSPSLCNNSTVRISTLREGRRSPSRSSSSSNLITPKSEFQLHPWSEPTRIPIKQERETVLRSSRVDGTGGSVEEDSSLVSERSNILTSTKVKASKSKPSRSQVTKPTKLSIREGLSSMKSESESYSFLPNLDDQNLETFHPPSFPESHVLMVRIRPFNYSKSIAIKSLSKKSSKNTKERPEPVETKSGTQIYSHPRWKIQATELSYIELEILKKHIDSIESQSQDSNRDSTPASTHSSHNSSASKPQTPTSSNSLSFSKLSPRSKKRLLDYRERKSQIQGDFEFLPTAFDVRSHRKFLASRAKEEGGKTLDLKKLWTNWAKSQSEVKKSKGRNELSSQLSLNENQPFLGRNLRRGIKLREREDRITINRSKQMNP